MWHYNMPCISQAKQVRFHLRVNNLQGEKDNLDILHSAMLQERRENTHCSRHNGLIRDYNNHERERLCLQIVLSPKDQRLSHCYQDNHLLRPVL